MLYDSSGPPFHSMCCDGLMLFNFDTIYILNREIGDLYYDLQIDKNTDTIHQSIYLTAVSKSPDYVDV